MEETREREQSALEEEKRRGKLLDRLIGSKWFGYSYMISILMYILLCGYFLFFSGSLLVEAVASKWYSVEAAEIDQESFLLGYLYGFPSLLGLIGGIAVMATKPRSGIKFKVLLFIPTAVWSVLLVLDLLRRPMYYGQLMYHIPAMLLCLFVLLGVIRKARVPYLDTAEREIRA